VDRSHVHGHVVDGAAQALEGLRGGFAAQQLLSALDRFVDDRLCARARVAEQQ